MPGDNDQVGDLRRQETAQPAHALDLADLIVDALLEATIERGKLVVQPRVLDGDHRLVGENLDHLYLSRSKWLRRDAKQTQDAEDTAITHKRHPESRA